MAHNRGDSFYMEFNSVVVQTDYRTISVDRSVDVIDVSAGADADKQYITGLRDATGSITVLDNGDGGTAILAVLYEGNTQVLTWSGPEGTATGKPKYSCTAIITSVQPSISYDAETTWSYNWQKTGPWLLNYDISGDTW